MVGSGDGIERTQGVVEIEQQHFVRNFCGDSSLRLVQRKQRIVDQSLVPNVGEETGLRLHARLSADVSQDCGTEFGDALPSDRRSSNPLATSH